MAIRPLGRKLNRSSSLQSKKVKSVADDEVLLDDEELEEETPKTSSVRKLRRPGKAVKEELPEEEEELLDDEELEEEEPLEESSDEDEDEDLLDDEEEEDDEELEDEEEEFFDEDSDTVDEDLIESLEEEQIKTIPRTSKIKKQIDKTETNSRTFVNKSKAKSKESKEALGTEAAPRRLFGSQEKSREIKMPAEGEIMTRNTLLTLLSRKMNINKADVERFIRLFEEFMVKDVFPHHSVNMFGTQFKRTIASERVITGTGGLNVKAPEKATYIPPHINVTATLTFGKEKRKISFKEADKIKERLEAEKEQLRLEKEKRKKLNEEKGIVTPRRGRAKKAK